MGEHHTPCINAGIILHFSIMKEVIMKKILFWIVLIVGVVALLGSCAKKDEKTAATAAADNATATAASTLDPPTCPSDNTDCLTAGWHQNAMDWNAVSGATSYTIYWSTSTGVSSSSTAITGISTHHTLPTLYPM